MVDPAGLQHHLQTQHVLAGGLRVAFQPDWGAVSSPADSAWHWHWVLPGELGLWAGGESSGLWTAYAVQPPAGMADGLLFQTEASIFGWNCYGLSLAGFERPGNVYHPVDLELASSFSAVSLTALYCVRLC